MNYTFTEKLVIVLISLTLVAIALILWEMFYYYNNNDDNRRNRTPIREGYCLDSFDGCGDPRVKMREISSVKCKNTDDISDAPICRDDANYIPLSSNCKPLRKQYNYKQDFVKGAAYWNLHNIS